MIVRTAAQRPMIFPFRFRDAQIVDARDATPHQAVLVKFPVLITVRAVPITAVIVPLVCKAHRDSVSGSNPDLFDEPVIEFARPLAPEESDDFSAAGEDLGPVSPPAVFRICRRDALGLARIPRVFGHAHFLRGGLESERR